VLKTPKGRKKDVDIIFVNVASTPLCDVAHIVKDLSGFTGSAGFLAVDPNEFGTRGAIFVDSRYAIQAEIECDDFDVIEYTSYEDFKNLLRGWCNMSISSGTVIGCINVSMRSFAMLEKLLPYASFIPIQCSPTQTYTIETYSEKYAGVRSRTARGTILPKEAFLVGHFSSTGGLLLTSSESIAWLYNLRSKELINCSPTFPCMALITLTQTYLFLPENSFNGSLTHWHSLECKQIPLQNFYSEMAKLIRQLKVTRISLDDSEVAQELYQMLHGIAVKRIENPVHAAMCRKNNTELANAQHVNELDSAAIIKLLAWIDSCDHAITEQNIADKLEEFRMKIKRYKGPSFSSIVAAGPNAVAVHHKAEDVVAQGSVLIDVGGQYLGGTTDMTRTIWIDANKVEGNVTRKGQRRLDHYMGEIIHAYTQVLRGHIALARLKFPVGTPGFALDAIARQFLWGHHQDYGHGTGHGVGSYLNVHEGPHGISRANGYPLASKMIVSNEPGFYKFGCYGIRLENLMQICKDTNEFLRFKMLTLVPFCARLVDLSRMTAEDKVWLRWYHGRILEEVKPHLAPSAKEWLTRACDPFVREASDTVEV
jgi:Xaa-Pro aminopeptidase